MDGAAVPALIRALKEGSVPQLTILAITSVSGATAVKDAGLANCLNLIPKLQSLTLRGGQLSELAFNALKRHFTTLTCLSVVGNPHVTGPMVQQVLESCPLLEEICASRIDALLILRGRRWQCLNLKRFRVCISVTPSHQHSITILSRMVFVQLARLTRLQELEIGKRSTKTRIQSLDLRLTSGLYQLAGLNDLRVIRYTGTIQEYIQAIYPLLDHHGKTRFEVHSSCMKALKTKLLHKLETTQMDDARFEATLKQMLPYIDVEGLRELPLTLLGRFPDKIPKKFLTKIAATDALFKIAPKEVQRRVWVDNQTKFREDIIPVVREYMTDPDIVRLSLEMSIEHPAKVITQRRSHASIKILMDMIGGITTLYNYLGMYLRSLYVQTNDAVYCTLRFDLLMAMHEANMGSITNVDPCHELVWNLDACNRTMSMDERRVANIRKFFDKVGRDDPVHGDIAMILNDPFTSNMIASRLLDLLNEATQNGKPAQSEEILIWTATMLNLGAHARRIINSQKFRIPKVESIVTEKFLTMLTNCILDDTLGQLKREADENVEYEIVEFTEDNLIALNDSEVARKLYELDIHALARTLPYITSSLRRNSPYDYNGVASDALHVTYRSFFHSFLGMLSRQTQLARFLVNRKLQNVILQDLLLPCAELDTSAYEQILGFLLESFRLVVSSGKAGSIADGFTSLGRWLEQLYVNRPKRFLDEKKEFELQEVYANILADASTLSQGKYRPKPEDIPQLMPHVQAFWERRDQMDTSV
ncbi:Cofactor of BRCA1 [Podila humilis]|nr:Cofactor of BRCA1 [Podila humilis]